MAGTTIAATDKNDNLVGTDGDDVVNGGLGKDTITLKGGNDVVYFSTDVTDGVKKAAGSVTLDFSAMSSAVSLAVSGTVWKAGSVALLSELTPKALDVSIVGSALNDSFSGLGHVRGITFDAGAGNDTLIVGNGDDVLNGGDGNDTISLGYGNDKINFGTGTNQLFVNAGLNGREKILIDLGEGTSKIWATVADFTKGLDAKYNSTFSGDLDSITLNRAAEITGSDGTDNVRILAGTGHVLNLGGGADYVLTKLAGITANGGAGNDVFDGIGGDKVGVVGLTSTFNGGDGDDLFLLRNDKAFGGNGKDTFAGTGTVEGGAGNDIFEGGLMSLTYNDSTGIVYNGTGSEQKFAVMEFYGTSIVVDKYTGTYDFFQVGNIDGTVEQKPFDRSVAASSISHLVDGTEYTDTLEAAVNKVYGTASQDIFLGGKAANMYGQGGEDYFHLYGTDLGAGATSRVAYGGAGNDKFVIEDGFKGTVYGDAGQDLFHARAGSTVAAYGGLEGDAFYFETDGGKGNVTSLMVRDFKTDQDLLVVDRDFADSYADLMKMRAGVNSGYTVFQDADGDRLTVYGKFDANDLQFSF